jgi:CHAD domain-containing protein
LKIYIKAEHRRAHKGLSRTLASKRYARFVGRWAELLHASRIGPHAGGDSTRPILPAANRAIWDAYVRVRKGKRKIDRHCEIELLHALRKDCKKLRYLLEAFQSLYKAAPLRRAVDALRKLQDELGHICDIDVQANFLRECRPKASRHAAAEGEFEAAVIELENCLFHQKLALLETINRSLARFTSKSNHGRFVRLFDAGKTAG